MSKEPTFTTDRLRCWVIRAVPSPVAGHMQRDMVIACFNDGRDWPGIAVSATFWREYRGEVDWIEVPEMWRREGLATELIRGWEQWSGCIAHVTGVTPEGKGLERRFYGG